MVVWYIYIKKIYFIQKGKAARVPMPVRSLTNEEYDVIFDAVSKRVKQEGKHYLLLLVNECMNYCLITPQHKNKSAIGRDVLIIGSVKLIKEDGRTHNV